MKIYVAHSKMFDYINELYAPLKNIKGADFVFPHEYDTETIPSKEIIKTCDLFLAEVSFPGFGTGIEIGWADAFKIPVVFLIKEGYRISSSLKIISDQFIEYNDSEDLEVKINELIKNYGQ